MTTTAATAEQNWRWETDATGAITTFGNVCARATQVRKFRHVICVVLVCKQVNKERDDKDC